MPEPPSLRGKVTGAERVRRMDFVEEMITRLFTDSQIEQLCRAQFGIGRKGTQRLVASVRERWLRHGEKARPFKLEAQTRRLHRWLRLASSMKKQVKVGDAQQEVDAPEKYNWGAIAKIEHLLADLEGTRKPIEVKLSTTVGEALASIVVGMTPERRQQLLEQAMEQRRIALANGYEPRELPAVLPPPRRVVEAG